MEERRTTTIQFRATIKEKKLLKDIAKSLGCPVSGLIRNFINNKPIILKPDTENVTFLEAVSGIGNDFNRMTRLIENGQMPLRDDVKLLCRKIQEVLRELEARQ